VPLKCGALPDNLVESELFGHTRGAFTDAREAKQGLIRQALGGTLFLDEIEAIPMRAQIVLLRFLQDREYRPVGGGVVEHADIRIIGATNADLGALVKRGAFRADLLFRLNVLPLHLPPLRERVGDVTLLALTFLDRLNRQSGKAPLLLGEPALAALNGHRWPGNVRELENLIQRRFILATGEESLSIPAADLGIEGGADPASTPVGTQAFKIAKARAVAQFEKAYIEDLLSRTAGNISMASRLSGKDRSDIGKLLRKHGIGRPRFTESSQG
jgi:DNA-binding NtrC family response regulator